MFCQVFLKKCAFVSLAEMCDSDYFAIVLNVMPSILNTRWDLSQQLELLKMSFSQKYSLVKQDK